MQLLGSICEAICTPLRINPPLYRRRVDFFTKDRCFDCDKARRLLGFKPSQSLIGELIDIINHYANQNLIGSARLQRPSSILRSLDGRIYNWCDDDKSAYGWCKEQALGAVSHSLLETRFPAKLENINEQLRSEGRWSGQLVHRSKSGNDIQVTSKWRLITTKQVGEPLVLEINHVSSARNFISRAINGGILGTASALRPDVFGLACEAASVI